MRIAGELADVNGVLVVRGGDRVEAIHCGEQAAEAAREAQNEWEIARFAEIVATIRYFRGELDQARRLYNESLEIQKELGDQSGIARSLHQFGMLAEKQGDRAEALRLFRQSLGIFGEAQLTRRRGCPPLDRPRESQGRFLIGRIGLFLVEFHPTC